ncbi:unnamed protein product, partial [Vitis vinifera]
MESFPNESLLPSTLTSLHISNLPNLKSLDSNGLRHLTPLTTLSIFIKKRTYLKQVSYKRWQGYKHRKMMKLIGISILGSTTMSNNSFNHWKLRLNQSFLVWRLASREVVSFIRGQKLSDALLKKLERKLLVVHAVLNDAEVKQFTNPYVKKWLVLLKEAVYDAEDILDEITTEALRHKVEAAESQTSTSQVASAMRAVHTHCLGGLSSEDGWSLFKKLAFENGDSSGHPQLEAIGEKIVHKCQGLPLAIKAMGSLLHSKVEAREWDDVLNSELWDLPTDAVLPALRLSYYYLPSHLKRCFSYCSIFPKDYKFEKEKLVLLWMAEGLLEQSKSKKRPEEVGNLYFEELLSKSFFQNSVSNESCFVMHDLVNDLAQLLPESVCNLYNLQTMMLLGCDYLVELPSRMEKLINLRYLDIRYTSSVKEMPSDICKLKNLQSLSTFIVGQNGGLRLGALRELSGSLVISKLQNVVCDRDALEANMKDKKYLDELKLQWDYKNIDAGVVVQNRRDILSSLQPHTNLKRLHIYSFSGLSFPAWVGDPSFFNLVYLKLHNCNNCPSLPPLGQLPSLKHLSILQMKGVKMVGSEFYGNASSSNTIEPSFPSLQTLRFEKMYNWEKWLCCGSPQIREWKMSECDSIEWIPPSIP